MDQFTQQLGWSQRVAERWENRLLQQLFQAHVHFERKHSILNRFPINSKSEYEGLPGPPVGTDTTMASLP